MSKILMSAMVFLTQSVSGDPLVGHMFLIFQVQFNFLSWEPFEEFRKFWSHSAKTPKYHFSFQVESLKGKTIIFHLSTEWVNFKESYLFHLRAIRELCRVVIRSLWARTSCPVHTN